MDCTSYVAKTKAQLLCSWSAPLFSHMQKAGFLMMQLIFICSNQKQTHNGYIIFMT